MEKFLEKLKSVRKSVHLRPEAKEALRGRLVQFMDAADVVRERDLMRHRTQRSFINNPIEYLKTMPIAAIIAILVLVSGGTSLAAESALPGNILFPVKVHVNEAIWSAFTFNPEAKADFAVVRAERRLSEAAKLAAEGKLNAEAKAEAEANFKAQAESAQAQIAELKARGDVRGAANVASHFEGVLNAQVKVLGALRDEKKDVEPIDARAKNVLHAVVNERNELESDIAATSSATSTAQVGPDVKAAAEGKLNAAANVLASTRAFVENKKDKLSAAAMADIQANLQADADPIAQGQAKLQAGLFGEAFNLGNQAIRMAQEIRATVDADVNLNLNVQVNRSEHGNAANVSSTAAANANASSSLENPGQGSEHASSNAESHGELKVNLGL